MNKGGENLVPVEPTFLGFCRKHRVTGCSWRPGWQGEAATPRPGSEDSGRGTNKGLGREQALSDKESGNAPRGAGADEPREELGDQGGVSSGQISGAAS